MDDAVNPICAKFVSDATNRTKSAMGQFCLVALGRAHQEQYAVQYPDSIFRLGDGFPETPTREIKYNPTHKEIAEGGLHSLALVLEAALSDLVQLWFDFLETLYENAVRSTIEGRQNYSFGTVQPKILISDLIGPNAIDHVIYQIVRAFNFDESKLKFKTIRKIYGIDPKPIESAVATVSKFVLVRNLFEHHQGIPSAKDIQDVGGKLNMDAGEVQAGQQIVLNPYDIEIATDAMIEIANHFAI
ncbi:hypothetical protein LGM43_26740 [Burkholderia seminalis]|uniref:hypothetical protein n=1 Tax=Burkholderia seminalis TaxID=488731 RepID=UPI001CF49DAF|nr:hypothetical protein [Burkholderia seminalis]MCA7953871.1 hypothetical protein [Burkholderia seminalis]